MHNVCPTDQQATIRPFQATFTGWYRELSYKRRRTFQLDQSHIYMRCDTSNIHEGAAMCLLPSLVKNALTVTFNSRMSPGVHINPVVSSAYTTKLLVQKKNLLQSYPKVVNYLLKKFPNFQAIAMMNFKILRSTKPVHMTSIQNADILLAKSCKAAEVRDKLALSTIFIEVVFIHHRF